jgi:septal ring factor EnvC (AmiA/AmiB activator)
VPSWESPRRVPRRPPTTPRRRSATRRSARTQQANTQAFAADAVARQSAEEAARRQAAEAAQAKRQAAEEKAKKEREAKAASGDFPVRSSYTAAQVQAIARQIVPGGQFQCFSNIVDHESTWNYQAVNASSGAYGLFQALPGSKMSSAGADWQTDPATQIKWA